MCGGTSRTVLNLNNQGNKRIYVNTTEYKNLRFPIGTIATLVYDGSYFRICDTDNADVSVKQTPTTSNYNYPILFKNTTALASYTGAVRFDSASNLNYNPNTKVLSSTYITSTKMSATSAIKIGSCTLTWNSTDSKLDFVF